MKRLINTVAVVVSITFMIVSSAMADAETINGCKWIYKNYCDEAVISCNPYAWLYYVAVLPPPIGSLEIPSMLGGMPVTRIDCNAFEYCNELTEVTIPNSVISIGRDAFWRCENLVKVTIPSSVSDISSEAFDFCGKLKTIEVDADNRC